MIPGISVDVEARLARLLVPEITDLRAGSLSGRTFALLSGDDPEAAALGITHVGGPALTIVVTDLHKPVGNVRIQTGGANNVVFFDNAVWTGTLIANFRMSGADNLAFFNAIGDYVAISDVLMRSQEQILFWGQGATAVSLSVEIEGQGAVCAIGDDALISNGVWIRNYDMHALHDLRTGAQINRMAADTLLERHVWLGQDALLLHCERVGMGSIVGARTMLKGTVPPRVVVAGTPARVMREETSWGRHPYGMTNAERRSIGLGDLPEG